MMKCFYTGIELKRDEAYLLDIGEARRILQELRNKAESVENLIKEMGEIDVVEITSREGKRIKQRRKRLVCKQLAETFASPYQGKNIFIRWSDWIAKTSPSAQRVESSHWDRRSTGRADKKSS